MPVLGEKGLVDVFDDFGDNWRIHRERLTDELEKLSKILTTAAKAYEDIDHQLADALRGTDPKKPTAKEGPR
ncbi:type VII secretion target [Streptomyces sp. NPDC092369]|uniref:type VII secretion target n=1 Tax=Streptomyces sp. NPDC092369 TaxID=3366015 RepID=UPI003810093F